MGTHQQSHLRILFLHDRLAKRKCDRYIANLAVAYHELGHHVTFYTSNYAPNDITEEFKILDKFEMKYCGWWIPRSIFGYFKETLSQIKSLFMTLVVILTNYYSIEPNLVVLDIELSAICLLNTFTKYRIFYVETFQKLRTKDFSELSRCSPTLLEAKCIKQVEEILVESATSAEILKKSYPSLPTKPVVLYPSVDVGLWLQNGIEIERIVPDVTDKTILFVTVGKYRRSSNFLLALDSFEVLLRIFDVKETTKRFHLVIAGNCKGPEEIQHYNELMESAIQRVCAAQITFLNQLPTVHEKTLIQNAEIIIDPSKSSMNPDFILRAMSLGKPIVATNRGIAVKLLQNRVSGMTTDPEPAAMAQVLKKLMMSSHLLSFMGELAKDVFEKRYSFKSFCNKLNRISCKGNKSSSNEEL